MKRIVLLLSVAAIATTSLIVQSKAQSSSTNDPAKQFIGTWKLITTIQRKADGSSGPNPVYGPKGIGYIMYTEAGRMCATLADPTVANWKTPGKPTETEARNAVDHFHAYCGRYTVNAAGGYVTHHVEMDNIPNDVGIDRRRFFKFTGNRLLLTADPPPTGTTEYTLTLERVVN